MRTSDWSWPIVPILLCILHTSEGQFRSPQITENPADLLVPRNEPATLNCKAVGKPKPRITWYKDGVEFKFKKEGGRHVLLENGDLFFLRVLQTKKDDDSGHYWCVATNQVNSVRSQNASLEIAVLKIDFSEVPEDARVAEGATAYLKCVPPKGHPGPVVSWTKDGLELDPATQHRFKIVDKGSLVITNVRVSDSGDYMCRARNVYGSRQSPSATLAVLVPPHLVSTSGDMTGTSGSTIELVCRVGGDPPPEVFWEKISKGELPIERMSQEENGQVLRIRHAAPRDQGVYACSAENPVGSVAANISLTIHSRPVITVSPLEARVGINGTATFECETSGNPPPTTYWTYEGTGIVVGTGQTWGEGRVFVDAHNTLTLRAVSKDDQGFYVCSAVGVAGSALARAHLEVQSVTDMPPPLIALGAPNQTLPLGTEGEMPCDARGTPEPRISWYQGEKPFVPTDRAAVTPFGTLRITNLKDSDTGVYTCKAVSESGTTEWTTSLAVAKPTNPNVAFFKMPRDTALPEPPGHVTVQSINRTSLILGWRRGRPGSSPILGYSVQLWSPDLRGPWQTATTRPLSLPTMPVGVQVTGLVEDTRYVFVVRASNSHGLSRPSDVTTMIKTVDSNYEGDVTLRDIRGRLAVPVLRLMTVEAVGATSLRVTWQLLVDESLLEGVYVRYRPVEGFTYSKSSSGALSVETVHLHRSPTSDSSPITPNTFLVTGLRPATEYEVFVSPFYGTVEGQPSAAVRRSTIEAIPEAAPVDLHHTALNDTLVRLTWKPIPRHLTNGKIVGYHLKVVDESETNHLLFNETITKTWILISHMVPGSAYHATVVGLTSKGWGPESRPLTFTMPDVSSRGGADGTKETSAGSGDHDEDFPAFSVETNYYLIVGIVSASLILSAFLFAAIFFIYRHRRKSKANPYFGKSESKDPWCDYPECWNESCKSMSGGGGGGGTTSTTNHSLHSMQRAYQKPSSPSYCKSRVEDFDRYKIKPVEDVYEDPDGLRLVSFSKYAKDKRCKSPEPYATTPLITDYKGSIQSAKYLPPNIPVKDLKPEDTNRLLNFNTAPDKDPHLVPIFQFPPPPPAGPIDDSFSDLSFGRRHEFTRFLQQQLPYSLGGSSFGGSSSGGSQKSHESPLVGGFGPPPLRGGAMKLQMPQHLESRLLPHQEISLVVDPTMESYREALYHSQMCQIALGGRHSPPRVKNSFECHKGLEAETYSEPHVRDSPNSSAMGDGEESDTNGSSASSCCSSAHPPVVRTHELSFVECLKAASDHRWPTDTAKKESNGCVRSIPRGGSNGPNKMGSFGADLKIEAPPPFGECVTSPLI